MSRKQAYRLLAVGLVVCLPTLLSAQPPGGGPPGGGPPGGGPPGGGPPSATVQVDCTDPDPANHDSISAALNNPARELTVEISGICEEEVQIRRNSVTLRGTDPLVDGIRPGPDEPLDQALNLFGVHLVVIENLKLTGGRVGLGINASFAVDVINCRVEDNEIVGVIFGSASGSDDLVDTVVTGNGATGIWVANGSSLRCTRCAVDDHSSRGIQLTEGSEFILTDSTVEGFRAIDARGGSRVFGSGANAINGLPWALRTRGTVSVELFGPSIDGKLDLQQGSTIKLSGATHTNVGAASLIRSGSTLVLDAATTMGGDLELTELSKAVFPDGASISGSLSCNLGADAFCDDPVASVGSTSNCGQCPKP